VVITVRTLAGSQSQISDDSLEDLRMRLRGDAVTPSDPGYENGRIPFNAMHVDHPGLLVRCRGTADVVDAVNFARDNGIEVTVRGGGHSIAGLSSSDGGMVIDLSLMRGVNVDPEARVARVQGGALLGDVDRETQAFGLATPLGAVSETGVAGLTLGGGYGWLRHKYGLACDNLVAAQVVCADGEVRTASTDVNPDLFWAIRGGGGNFGIVTSFTFRLHPLGPVVAFAGVFYRLSEAAAVLGGFRDYAERAPEEVTPEAIAVATTMPPDPHLPEPVHNEQVLIIGGVYAGDPEEGMTALLPLRELGTPLADISQPMPFTVVQSAFDGFFPRGQLQGYWKSLYLREFSDEAIDLTVHKTQKRPKGGSDFEFVYADFVPMGGAVNRVDPEETAFSERSAPWLVAVDANWTNSADNANNIAWVRQSVSELEQYGTGTTYLNFTGLKEEPLDTGVDEMLGRNLQRLAEVKKSYDPDNFFRRNNNIAPAAN
jgi:FAD/FMN-containing dehydrogenase